MSKTIFPLKGELEVHLLKGAGTSCALMTMKIPAK